MLLLLSYCSVFKVQICKSFFTAAVAANEVFFAYFLVHKKVWWA